jgi:hypothetical protein
MKAIAKFLAGGIAIAALGAAAPAAAQYYPGYTSPYGNGYSPYGYNQYGYNQYSPYGYNQYGSGMANQTMVSQCVGAVQARLGGGYGGYGDNPYGYGGGRVLGISRVEPRGDGGFTVRGVATSGTSAYGYAPNSPNLVWRCRTDFRGAVVDVDVERARSNDGYDYDSRPGNYDYSPYGYQRY